MSLAERLLNTTKVKEADVYNKSNVLQTRHGFKIPLKALSIALTGSLTGLVKAGIVTLAGPSKHFKSNLMLSIVAAYMNENPDAVFLFYDSEFGSKTAYFESAGIDVSRVVHIPITNIEVLKTDLVNQLKEITRKDKVIVGIDSIGNLASIKELEDAEEGDVKADMTRAKSLKSLGRMITPMLNLKDVPLIAINHTYMTQEKFSKAVVSGGTGVYYSSDDIIIIGRSQEKTGTDITGWTFNLNAEKSRTIHEKSKIPFTVYKDGGLPEWSGILDIAIELGFVTKTIRGSKGTLYTRKCVPDDAGVKIGGTLEAEFWEPLMKNGFDEAIQKKYKLGTLKMGGAWDGDVDEEGEGDDEE